MPAWGRFPRNDDPDHACRPFDKERDGFVCGEGAGVMILESEAHARARGAQLLAEVRGGRITGDGYHITAPEPSGNGAARAIRNAIKAAGLQPEDIDLIYAHGTGTTLNDAVETTAIKKALGQHAYSVAVTATKSMIGHTLARRAPCRPLARCSACMKASFRPPRTTACPILSVIWIMCRTWRARKPFITRWSTRLASAAKMSSPCSVGSTTPR
ncbi:beta-ketoacyl synthase N-terminal-like domain-containing protein [Candidatus Amarolinea dominans]|uniref:beta-ketoacyl-[acyl-carrier-protein] synthase family protein n=1 Tax=Candidatus Amarolinea dominans TaxID=3140696 RepID=UPI0031CC73B0